MGYLNTNEWKNYSFYNKRTGKTEIKKSHEILKDKLDFKKRITEYTARNTKGCIESYFEKNYKIIELKGGSREYGGQRYKS